MNSKVRLEMTDGVAVITLDDPPTRNAIDLAMAAELVAAYEVIDADPTIGAAVIRGAGNTFCSGGSRTVLAELATAPPDTAIEVLGTLYESFNRFSRLSVPSLARMEGAAVGAGLNLALAADVRIATPDAVLIPGFAPLGIHPGGGNLHLLARAAGRQTAAAMGMFGRQLTGEEAESLGLVWAAVPSGKLDDTVEELVRHLTVDPDLARAIKASYVETTGSSDQLDRAVDIERARQLWSFGRTRPTRP